VKQIKGIVDDVIFVICRPNFIHGEAVCVKDEKRREMVFSGGRTFSEVMLSNAKKSKQ